MKSRTSTNEVECLLLTEVFPPKPGGSGRWFYEVYSRIKSNVMVVTDEGDPDHIEPCDPSFVARTSFRLRDTGGLSPRGAWGYLRLLRRVRSITKGKCIGTVQAARVVPEGWLAWLWQRLGGPRYQCFAHGEEINLENATESGVMSSRQHRWMAKRVFQCATQIIANSRNTASILENQWQIPRDKIVVAHPGVDANFFSPRETTTDEARTSLGWGDSPVLLTVGRLQARKGHDRVIETLARLGDTIPNMIYAIAGNGCEEKRLVQLASRLGVGERVRWYKECSDEMLLSLYQNCNIFILANRQVGSDIEGFGMVLLEAAACGKATIAGKSGGTSEAIDDGVTGVLVDATSVSEISEAVISLLSSDPVRSKMGTAGRRRVETTFDWEIVAKKVSEALASDHNARLS